MAYYPSDNCGGEAVPAYSCAPCVTYEYGRIRSFAFIKTTFIDSLIADPENHSLWMGGIDSGDIVPVWKTKGTYDGGSTAENPGFGDSATSNGNTTHILTFDDPNYTENCDFYNNIRNSSAYSGAYRTSDHLHFIDAPLTITPKNPVQDDINSFVTWNVQVKWTDPDSPCPVTYDTAAFDQCIVNE